MSEIAVTVVKVLFLALLWLFILSAVSVVRSDLFGRAVAAEDGQIGQAAYSASKGGVLAMTLPIARDLMNEGVRVNTILPGVFKTPMVAMMPPQVQDALAAQVPFPKRLGRPEEYANLAVFMVESGYMNAESVRLDGGIRMAPK